MNRHLSSLLTAIAASPAAAAALMAAFSMGFSLPTARAFTALTGVLVLVDCIRHRKRPCIPPVTWIALLFIIIALIATLTGIRPEQGLDRFHKLAWFIAIPIMATAIDSWQRLRRFTIAFVLGTAILAIRVCIEHPLVAWQEFQAGHQASFAMSLINNSSLSDAQRLAVGLLAGLCLFAADIHEKRKRLLWIALFIPTAIAEVICLKRGPWIALAICGSAIAMSSFGWRRVLPLLVLGAALLGALPPVRTRISQLRDDADASHGGRMTMWTEIAPQLLREHPWGVGFRSLRNKDLRKISPHVERRQDHLHSTPVQVAVSTGWHGLAIYLLWMLCSLRDAWRTKNNGRDLTASPGVPAKAPLAILSALILIGIVEYNLADADILIIYAAFIGLSGRFARLTPSTVTAQPCKRPETASP